MFGDANNTKSFMSRRFNKVISKINAWENAQKASAEASLKKAEVCDCGFYQIGASSHFNNLPSIRLIQNKRTYAGSTREEAGSLCREDEEPDSGSAQVGRGAARRCRIDER